MSNVIMTIRLMPSGIEVDLNKMEEDVKQALKDYVNGEMGFKVQPIAFGLKALDITLITNEDNGSIIEESLKKVPGVQSVTVQSVSLT